MNIACQQQNEQRTNMIILKHIVLASSLIALGAQAQDRYMTRTGYISFHSETPMETIHGDNRKVTSVWDATTGAVEFAVLIKAFEFKKALMQEHFNENYMESNTFPKANFKGKVTGVTAEQLKKPGTYDVVVEGELTMHGVTKPVKYKGTVTVDATGVKANCDFGVKPGDYDIEIPSVVRDNIAEEIKVMVRMDYQKM